MSARKTYTPAEALRVGRLRAEARAWRASARLTDGWRNTLRAGYGPPTILMTRRDAVAGLAHQMWTRWLAGTRGSTCSSLTNDREASVWFALVLALECEDEARALGRGAR